MKILIKNLHSQSFSVECELNEAVKTLKEKIAASEDAPDKYDPELIKLLCTGKVMDDEERVDHYPVTPDGHLVLVKQLPGKPKPPPKKKPNQGFGHAMGGFGSNSFMQPFQHNPFGGNAFGPQAFGSNTFGQHGFGQNSFGSNAFDQNSFGESSFPQPSFGQSAFPQPSFGQSAFPQPSFGQSALNQNQLGSQAHTPAIGTTGSLADAAPGDFTTAEDRENALQNLISMGFDREESEKALRLSYYNVETAVDLITSGNLSAIPDVLPTSSGTGLGTSTGSQVGQGRQPSPPAVRRSPAGGY